MHFTLLFILDKAPANLYVIFLCEIIVLLAVIEIIIMMIIVPVVKNINLISLVQKKKELS